MSDRAPCDLVNRPAVVVALMMAAAGGIIGGAVMLSIVLWIGG